jgi:hypothetical protein
MQTAAWLFLLAMVCPIFGQTDSKELALILTPARHSQELTSIELRRYLLKKVPSLPAPSSAAEWTSEQKRLRADVLQKYIYAGWPRTWVDGRPAVEDLGFIPGEKGYRMRKLRYEIVPDFWATARQPWPQ